MKMFKIGDRVIHGSYGLCKIRGIESCDTYYGIQDCYIIYIERTKIMIPVAHADTLRYPIKKEEVHQVLGTLETLERLEELPDYVFEGEAIDLCSKKNAVNDIFGTAGLLRDLTFLNEKNSFRGPAKNLLDVYLQTFLDTSALFKFAA